MNDSKLITIDDESLEQVSGGTLGLLFGIVALPFKIIGGLLGGGGYCAPQPPACPPPRPPKNRC